MHALPIRQTIDGRLMEPPEPLERTLDALEMLGPGESVLLLLHREPLPLYQLLASSGHAWQTERRTDGVYAVHIWRHSA